MAEKIEKIPQVDEKKLDKFFNKRKFYMRLGLIALFVIFVVWIYRKATSQTVGY